MVAILILCTCQTFSFNQPYANVLKFAFINSHYFAKIFEISFKWFYAQTVNLIFIALEFSYIYNWKNGEKNEQQETVKLLLLRIIFLALSRFFLLIFDKKET